VNGINGRSNTVAAKFSPTQNPSLIANCAVSGQLPPSAFGNTAQSPTAHNHGTPFTCPVASTAILPRSIGTSPLAANFASKGCGVFPIVQTTVVASKHSPSPNCTVLAVTDLTRVFNLTVTPIFSNCRFVYSPNDRSSVGNNASRECISVTDASSGFTNS
jgi:hypothetical protein